MYIYDTNAKWKSMQLPAGSSHFANCLFPSLWMVSWCMNAPRQWRFRHTATEKKDTLWEEQKRLKNPDIVPVDLSDKLSAMKLKLIEAATMI